jgi:chemotaxis protein CheD
MVESPDAVREVYIQPGESHLSLEPVRFRTVLGSCVGVIFWAPRQSYGALCHPMLPEIPKGQAGQMHPHQACRYVDFAIRDMVMRFDDLGIPRHELRVKLFGGGDVLLVTGANTRPTVGKLNCETALRVTEEEGLNVVASSLGGTSGLHIQYYTATGEVLLRRLK